jgi:hypothetical protein
MTDNSPIARRDAHSAAEAWLFAEDHRVNESLLEPASTLELFPDRTPVLNHSPAPLPADKHPPAAHDLLTSLKLTKKEKIKLKRKAKMSVYELNAECPYRSQHFEVDEGWRGCEICMVKIGKMLKRI